MATNKCLHILWGLWLTALPALLSAQYASTRLYTVEDGLPMTEVADAHVGPDGKLWLSLYSKGIYTYDGNHFQEVHPDLSINQIYFDGEGRTWLGSVDKIYLSAGDSLLSWDRTGPTTYLDSIPAGANLGEGGLIRTDSGPIWFTTIITNKPALYRFSSTCTCFVLRDSVEVPGNNKPTRYLFKESGQPNYISSGARPLTHIYKRQPDGLKLIKTAPANDSSGIIGSIDRAPILFRIENGRMKISGLRRILLDLPLPELNNRIADLHFRFRQTLTTNRILILLQDGPEKHLYDFSADFKSYIYTRFRFPSYLLQIDQDPSGVYWGASHSGLLRIFPQYTNFFAEENLRMLPDIHALVKAPDGKLWFGSYGRGFGYIQKDEVFPPPPSFPKDLQVLPGAQLSKAGDLIFSVSAPTTLRGLVRITPDNRLEPAGLPILGYYFSTDRQGRLIYGTNKEGLLIQNNPGCFTPECWTSLGPEKGFALQNVIAAAQDPQGRYWMSRPSRGLAVYLPERDTILNFLKENNQTERGVWSMAFDGEDRFWMGDDRGLYLFKPPPDIGPGFRPDDYAHEVSGALFGDKEVRSLAVLDEQYLVLGTSTGMGLLDLASYTANPDYPVAFHFDKEAGYTGLAGEQNAVWVDENKDVWLANDRGVTRFNSATFRPKTSLPKVKITDLSSYGERFDLPDNNLLKLSQQNTNIRISFEVETELALNNQVTYLYGVNSDSLQATQEPQVRFTSLRAGDYTFTVYALRNGIRSAPAQIRFRISRPFVERPIFYILISLFLVTVFGGFFFLKRQQERRRRQLMALRVQTVVNQLNPHFINNALGWVQVRAKEQDDDDAVAIIGKLAHNIKTIFQNSREKRSHHSLAEELRLVRNYLAIQRARFGDKLQYFLPPHKVIEDWGDAVDVPLMMMQLHCENAVEHGIRNRREGGYVRIDILEEGPDLLLVIEDNGVGRRRAEELGSMGTQQGIRMMDELIQVFNRLNPRPIRQEYQDDLFTDEQGCAHGTRVIIRLPKRYHYELTTD